MANGEEMTEPEQIEAVARAMCHERHPCWSIVWEIFETDHDGQATEFLNYAAVAINTMRQSIRAEALEEAAKVADGYHRTKEVTRDLMDDGHITTTTVRSLADPLKIAAAIRALKEKP
jgi:hypothetical protein